VGGSVIVVVSDSSETRWRLIDISTSGSEVKCVLSHVYRWSWVGYEVTAFVIVQNFASLSSLQLDTKRCCLT